MHVKGFGINIDKSKRLWGIIFIALLVAVLLIGTSFFLVFSKFESAGITKISDLFNAKSYYAEYSVRVVSNKNENEYKLKEWYVNDESDYKFRIETDNLENNFVYFGNQNSLYIKSDEQLNNMNLSEYDLNKSNILSISTFMKFLYELDLMINGDSNSFSNCCKIEEIEEDELLKFVIHFCGDNCSNSSDNCNCNLCGSFLSSGMNIGKLELVLDKEKLIPVEYIIYDENDKIYIDILYSKFSINKEFEEKLFAF